MFTFLQVFFVYYYKYCNVQQSDCLFTRGALHIDALCDGFLVSYSGLHSTGKGLSPLYSKIKIIFSLKFTIYMFLEVLSNMGKINTKNGFYSPCKTPQIYGLFLHNIINLVLDLVHIPWSAAIDVRRAQPFGFL